MLYKAKPSGLLLAAWVLISCIHMAGQSHGATVNKKGSEYSGMYSFLREGEFVQVTVEQGSVSGFVSRYGDSETDQGEFLDHFFKQGKLDGNLLTFSTVVVHGLSYEFRGTVERGNGKNPGDEAYYLLKGTLTINTMDKDKKVSSRSTEVTLKSFPQDLTSGPAGNK